MAREEARSSPSCSITSRRSESDLQTRDREKDARALATHRSEQLAYSDVSWRDQVRRLQAPKEEVEALAIALILSLAAAPPTTSYSIEVRPLARIQNKPDVPEGLFQTHGDLCSRRTSASFCKQSETQQTDSCFTSSSTPSDSSPSRVAQRAG